MVKRISYWADEESSKVWAACRRHGYAQGDRMCRLKRQNKATKGKRIIFRRKVNYFKDLDKRRKTPAIRKKCGDA